jgi:hypothetical protein
MVATPGLPAAVFATRVPCGSTGDVVFTPGVTSCACVYHPNMSVTLDARIGTPMTLPGTARCNTLSIPLGPGTNPTCKPVFTVTGDPAAGTLACTAVCS